MNKELEKEVKGLQGGMVGAAERYPLPNGYTVEPNERGSGMIITAPNGKSSEVGLYAYGNVRKVLTELSD